LYRENGKLQTSEKAVNRDFFPDGVRTIILPPGFNTRKASNIKKDFVLSSTKNKTEQKVTTSNSSFLNFNFSFTPSY
jgi:hypothetical protein